MSYIDANLVPGEKVIYQTRLHWIVMLGHLLFAGLVLALPGLLLLYYARTEAGTGAKNVRLLEGGAGVLLISAVVVVIAGLVRRNSTEMAVTTRRVVIKTGLAARKTIEML